MEVVLSSFFGTLTFDCGNCTNVFVNLLVESNGAPAIVDKVKLHGAGLTNCSANSRMPHGHALLSTSAADLVVIESIKVDKNLASLSFLYPFIVTMKVKAYQHLAAWVCMRNKLGTPRR